MEDLNGHSSSQRLVDENSPTLLISFPESSALSQDHDAPKKPLNELLEGAGPSMFDEHGAFNENDPQALSAASTNVLQGVIDHRGAVELVRRLSTLLAERDAHITALTRLAEEYKVPRERLADTALRARQAEQRRLSLAAASENLETPTVLGSDIIDSNLSETPLQPIGRMKGITRLFGGSTTARSRDTPTSSRSTSRQPHHGKRPSSVDVRSIQSVQSADSNSWRNTTTHFFNNSPKRQNSQGDREPVEMITRHDKDQLPPTLSQQPQDIQQAANPQEAAWNRYILQLMKSRQQSGEDTGAIGLIGASRFGHEGQEGRQRMQVLVRLIIEGVPIKLRHSIWMELSNVDAILQPQGFYHFLNQGYDQDPGEREAILKDVPRTLTSKYDFYADKGFTRLKDVLVAFVGRYKQLGYTQGLNTIAGYLLLTIPVEDDAFWMLCNLVENYFPENYFSGDYAMEGPQADNTLLRHYVKQLMPQLNHHLDEINIPATHTVPMKWFFTAFSNVVPETLLMRIWDVWLCLPNQKHFLFNVALLLLSHNADGLMACDSDAACYAYLDNDLKVPDEPEKITKFIRDAFSLGRRLEDIDEKRSQGLKWRLKRVGSVEVLMDEPLDGERAQQSQT